MDENKEVTPTIDNDWDEEPLLPDDDETPSGDAASETPDANPDGEASADAQAAHPDGRERPDAEKSGSPDENPDAPKEAEPDYKALYEGLQESQNAEKFRQVYREQLSLTGNPAVAALIAKNECGGKAYPVDADGGPDSANAETNSGAADFKTALTEIHKLYPDADAMPAEVMQAFQSGTPLKDAYISHRAKADADKIAALQREIDGYKKSASNRAAAPVKGATGDVPSQSDPFLAGFDSDEW